MAKASELREMSDEQIVLTWKEAAEQLFRLRLQAQTERLDVPSELRRQRRADRPLPDDPQRAPQQRETAAAKRRHNTANRYANR